MSTLNPADDADAARAEALAYYGRPVTRPQPADQIATVIRLVRAATRPQPKAA